MSWIKCSERLPQKDDHLIFTCDSKGIISDNVWYDYHRKKWQENSFMDYYGDCMHEITHWYPKPGLPDDT